MTNSQFNSLVQMIAALSERMEAINKENQKKFVTKEDLKKFATKKDLEKFITKKEAANFATKADLSEMAEVILKAVEGPYIAMEETTKNVEKRGKTSTETREAYQASCLNRSLTTPQFTTSHQAAT